MRASRLYLILLATALLVAVPTASATVKVSVKAPKDPLPWNAATTVDVTMSSSCSNAQNDAVVGNVKELEIAVTGQPPWLTATGSKVAWGTQEQCDTSTASMASTCTPQPTCAADYPVASVSGKLTLSPNVDAPAFQVVNLTVKIKGGEDGSTSFMTRVAYHGSLNASSNASSIKAGYGESVPFPLNFDVFTNGKSMIMLTAKEVPTHGGAVGGLPESVDIEPVTAYLMSHGGMEMWMEGGPGAGQDKSASLPLYFQAPLTAWGGDNYTVEASLISYDDATKTTSPVSVSWSFEPTGSPPATKKSGGASPAPDLVVILCALAGIGLLRRRASE